MKATAPPATSRRCLLILNVLPRETVCGEIFGDAVPRAAPSMVNVSTTVCGADQWDQSLGERGEKFLEFLAGRPDGSNKEPFPSLSCAAIAPCISTLTETREQILPRPNLSNLLNL